MCTGDIHSFYAAELHVDFDAPNPTPVGVEYVTAGISSASLEALMSKFVPEAVTRLTVTTADGRAVAVKRQGQGWIVDTPAQYPADRDKIQRAIDLSNEKYCTVFHTLRKDLKFSTKLVLE